MPLVLNPKRSFVIIFICCLFYVLMAKGVHVQSGTDSPQQRQSRGSSLLAETILSATIFAHFLA